MARPTLLSSLFVTQTFVIIARQQYSQPQLSWGQGRTWVGVISFLNVSQWWSTCFPLSLNNSLSYYFSIFPLFLKKKIYSKKVFQFFCLKHAYYIYVMSFQRYCVPQSPSTIVTKQQSFEFIFSCNILSTFASLLFSHLPKQGVPSNWQLHCHERTKEEHTLTYQSRY